VVMRACSGINATGKASALHATAARPQWNCGVRGSAGTMAPGPENSPAPAWEFKTAAPMPRPAPGTGQEAGRSRFLPLSTSCRSDGQAGADALIPQLRPLFSAPAPARGYRKTFLERRECARRYNFCARSSRFGEPCRRVALQGIDQDAT
jgi:hypothetical protein